MIPNMWYAVLESHEVKPDKLAAFRRLGEDLVFWRDSQKQIVVMRDLCPHRLAKLSPGKIVDGNIQCHFHGFQFGPTGTCQLVPANGRNGPKPKIFQCWTYPAQEAFGFIWVWYGAPQAAYPSLPFTEELDEHIYSTFRAEWDTHYSRAIQGLLDVSHLPFVHAKTIGRGGFTLVNGPYTTLENDVLRVWISNQPDQGLPAIKPTEVPPPQRAADIVFRFPNVWQLRLGENWSQVIAVVPVDDDHLVQYVRFYQRAVTQPIIGKAAAYIGNLYNRFVLSEDEQIILSQRPKKAGLDVGERFIPGDRPIALYLKHRRDLVLRAQHTHSTVSVDRPMYDKDVGMMERQNLAPLSAQS